MDSAAVIQLYTEANRDYLRFVRAVLYPQGIRAYFLRSPLLRQGLRVLDAGCGTGIVTLALRDALVAWGFSAETLDAFDLTPAMIDGFRQSVASRAINDVRVVQADVLRLDTLPSDWSDYDLVVSSAMLEYLPQDRVVGALASLRGRLDSSGNLILFITRRNWLTRPLIGRWWHANLYAAEELKDDFRAAGYSEMTFGRLPVMFRHLALWGYVVEAQP